MKCKYDTITESELLDKIAKGETDKYNLSINWILDEEFIIKHQDLIVWELVSSCQKLSKDFIIKSSYDVHWGNISEYQELSEQFVINNLDNINVYRLLQNDGFTKYSEVLQKIVLCKMLDYRYNHYFVKYFTNYMKEQYEKLSIML